MIRTISASFLIILLSACATSSHDTVPAQLGLPRSGELVLELARQPGPVKLTPVTAADWTVDRSGLLNLEHPKAQAAKLEDVPEPIVIRFYVLEHPERGTYLIDSGVANAFRSEDTAPVSALLRSFMHLERLKVHVDTAEWLKQRGERVRGVFLTHLHLDHIMGLPDVPSSVPVYTGPGEAASSGVLNVFVQGTTDGFLENASALREWQFERDASGRFAGVLDVFGDGSVFALHVPGHTPGSTAFLIRTPTGPELVTGDACHTSWGWEHEVEPGTFSVDRPESAVSLTQLKQLERDLPGLVVHVGHQ